MCEIVGPLFIFSIQVNDSEKMIATLKDITLESPDVT